MQWRGVTRVGDAARSVRHTACLVFAAALAASLGACASSSQFAQMNLASAKPGATVAFESIDGPPPVVFNKLLFLYRNPVFRVGEVGLVAAVLYHAINGVRICITDFWPQTMAFHRKLNYAVGILFTVTFIPAAVYMLSFLVK